MKRLLISVFVLWNSAAILLTNSQSSFISWSDQKWFLPYARLTRVMQRWALFSPEPRRYVHNYYFNIEFKNGTTTRWQRPYPPNCDYFERQHAYNWQKYDTASNHMEDQRLWPDLGAWIGNQFQSDVNPPVRIQLFRHAADTPPPNETGYALHDSSEFSFVDGLIFTYFPEKKSFL